MKELGKNSGISRRDFIKVAAVWFGAFAFPPPLFPIDPYAEHRTINGTGIGKARSEVVDLFFNSGRMNSADQNNLKRDDIIGLTTSVNFNEFNAYTFKSRDQARYGEDVMYVEVVVNGNKDYRRLVKTVKDDRVKWTLDNDTNPATKNDRLDVFDYPKDLSAESELMFRPYFYAPGVSMKDEVKIPVIDIDSEIVISLRTTEPSP